MSRTMSIVIHTPHKLIGNLPVITLKGPAVSAVEHGWLSLSLTSCKPLVVSLKGSVWEARSGSTLLRQRHRRGSLKGKRDGVTQHFLERENVNWMKKVELLRECSILHPASASANHKGNCFRILPLSAYVIQRVYWSSFKICHRI